MILLVGIKEDITLNYFLNFLEKNFKKFIFLDQIKIGTEINYDTNFIYKNDMKIPFEIFTGVFNRVTSFSPQITGYEYLKARFELLFDILDFEMKNVANRLIDCGSNYSKPYQLKYLQIFHLKIPEFSIMANSLQRKFDKRIIYKSTSFERSIVQELKKNDMDRPITSPVLFQELLEGINIRVHVLKNKVFSLEILSNKIDYRYSNTTVFNEIRLPKKIEEECIEITRQCNFIYSGIDLIKRDKYYYLLEVNPAPGFHYFEEQMKKKAISTELMNILS